MTSLALLIGLWTSTCIQTQMGPDRQGFVLESYEITKEESFRFSRVWFEDAACTVAIGGEEEVGTVLVGPELTGMFVTNGTFEADFLSAAGFDLGAVQVKNDVLKVARGTKGSTWRNTMLGLFGYKKVR